MNKINGLLVAAVLVLFAFSAQKASAAGFSVNTQSAFALGQGNAVIAHTSGPDSIFFNPALISQLPGTQVEIGTTMIFSETKFTSITTGQDAETHDPVAFPSTFFLTHKINDSFSAGVGFFSGFGLITNWPSNWEGRYIATDSRLTTFTLNPVMSYRPIPQLAVAAGFDVVFLDAELNKDLNFSALGLPDGLQRMNGTDTAYGFNLGLAADITKDITVGLAYRSKVRTDISGSIVNILPAGTPPPLAALFPTTAARTSFFLPASANFGVAYKGFKDLVIEAGGRWEGWSCFQNLEFKTVLPIYGMTDFIYPRNWKDIYSLNVGGRYQLFKQLGVSAGYILEAGPIPSETFEPSVPAGSSDVFMAGIDWKYRDFRVGLSYGYQHVHTREKDNLIDDPSSSVFNPLTSANGVYRTNLNMAAISVAYLF